MEVIVYNQLLIKGKSSKNIIMYQGVSVRYTYVQRSKQYQCPPICQTKNIADRYQNRKFWITVIFGYCIEQKSILLSELYGFWRLHCPLSVDHSCWQHRDHQGIALLAINAAGNPRAVYPQFGWIRQRAFPCHNVIMTSSTNHSVLDDHNLSTIVTNVDIPGTEFSWCKTWKITWLW